MALKKKKTADLVGKAVRRFYAFLKYRAIGPHALTQAELKDLILNGYIDPRKGTVGGVINTYNSLHSSSITGTTAAPKGVRDRSVDFLERMFNKYTDKAALEMENSILATAEHGVTPFFDEKEGRVVYGALKDLPSKKQSEIAREIRENIDNGQYRWKTIVKTEINRAANFGALDAIVHNNRGRDMNDVYVYKIGNSCNLACKQCCALWLMPDGVTPRVYRLSELVANGTNIGKKQADWKATVDSTHPHCTHTLAELQPGYGFVNGKLEYVSKDHDEHSKQKGV